MKPQVGVQCRSQTGDSKAFILWAAFKSPSKAGTHALNIRSAGGQRTINLMFFSPGGDQSGILAPHTQRWSKQTERKKFEAFLRVLWSRFPLPVKFLAWADWLPLLRPWAAHPSKVQMKHQHHSLLMKILQRWSHCHCVCFLTALLCGSAAICSPYSHISVVWDIRRGKLDSVSLIHLYTAVHFMAHRPKIPFRGIFSRRLHLYGGFCLVLLSFCFSSRMLPNSCCCFPPLGSIYSLCFLHLSNYLTRIPVVLHNFYIRTTT